MVLTETKLRSVVREELHQYLIEEGFFDKIKSGFQSLTSRGQTQQPSEREQALARLRAQSPVGVSPVTMSAQEIADQEKKEQQGSTSTVRTISDKYLKDMMRGRFTEIKNEKELNWFVTRLQNLAPQEAFLIMFNHLLLSMQYRVGNRATEREKSAYSIFVNDIAKQIEREQQGMLKEDYNKKDTPLNDQEANALKKKFLIPADLWQKTGMAFSDVVDTLVVDKKIKLMDLFRNNLNVLDAFVSLRKFLQMKPYDFETSLREKPGSQSQLTQQPKQKPQLTPSQQFFGKKQNIEERKNLKRRK